MTDPINLNRLRKARRRAALASEAAANAAKFGRRRSERLADTDRIERSVRALGEKKLEDE